MLEHTATRKNKINLADYDYQLDIESRIILSDFNTIDLEVLEEILFSPLKISAKKLSRTLDCPENTLSKILEKLVSLNLVQIQGDTLIVDKERRKYFEFQITRFADGFHPDMEFLQGLLKQVPIHVLPAWYPIPRSSNNIFESIVERYLQTPQIYQRYLMDLNFSDPVLNGIMHDVFSSPDFRISSSDLITKYNLARPDFEQFMLQLEFNFVCFVTYQKEDDYWHEYVMPIHEWREYLLFLQKTEVSPIKKTAAIQQRSSRDFAFVSDMGSLLELAQKKPISLEKWNNTMPLPANLVRQMAQLCQIPIDSPSETLAAQQHFAKVLEKVLLIKLADRIDGRLYPLDSASDWLSLNLENRALQLYRHPLNRIVNDSLPPHLCSERSLREAEKSIKRVLQSGWVLFDDFIQGAIVSLNDESPVILKKTGRQWKYSIPQYSDDERLTIRSSIFDFLFECGMTNTGNIDGRDCFSVTPFGQFFFEE